MPETEAKKAWKKKNYSSPYHKTRTSEKIVALIRKFGPMTAPQVAKILGVDKSKIAQKLFKLSDQGKLLRDRKEKWPNRKQNVYGFPKK